MQMHYYLSISIPHWDDTIDFMKMLKNTSYEHRYWRSIVPPNRFEIILGPLTEEGVNNWKHKFRETFIGASQRVKDGLYFRTAEKKEHLW